MLSCLSVSCKLYKNTVTIYKSKLYKHTATIHKSRSLKFIWDSFCIWNVLQYCNTLLSICAYLLCLKVVNYKIIILATFKVVIPNSPSSFCQSNLHSVGTCTFRYTGKVKNLVPEFEYGRQVKRYKMQNRLCRHKLLHIWKQHFLVTSCNIHQHF